MKSWSNIPAELLYSIFELIDNSATLFEFQLVCKNWSVPAQTVAYKTVEFTSQSQMLSFTQSMATSPRIASLVENISTLYKYGIVNSFSFSGEAAAKQFPLLLKYCHNLKSIYMAEFPDSKYLFNAIMQECNKGGCRLLKTIPCPQVDYDEDVEVYEISIIVLRDTLTSIMISDNSRSIGGNTSEKLKLFPHLKHISFRIRSHMTSLLSVLTSIRACDSLTTVEIVQSNPVLDTPLHPSHTSDYPLTTPYPNIQKLKASGIISSASLVTYLNHSFNNLSSLDIRFADENEFDLDQLPLERIAVSADICIKFLNHMYNKAQHINVKSLLLRTDAIKDEALNFLSSIEINGCLQIKDYDPEEPAVQIDFQKFDLDMLKSYPIKKLVLKGCFFSSDLLAMDVSTRLPTITIIIIDDCSFEADDTVNNWVLRMPFSPFDAPYWTGLSLRSADYSSTEEYDDIYLSLTTLATRKSTYYYGNRSSIIVQILEEDYFKQVASLHYNTLAFRIECDYIKTLIVDTEKIRTIIKNLGRADQEIIKADALILSEYTGKRTRACVLVHGEMIRE